MGTAYLLLALVMAVVSIYLFYNIELEEDYTAKGWSFVFGVAFFFATVYFTENAFKSGIKVVPARDINYNNNDFFDF